MGNCLHRPRRARGSRGGDVHCSKNRAAVWVEEEVVEKVVEEETRKAESAPATEVKIRITRKQLEELLRRVEDGKNAAGGGVPVGEVISELLCMASSSSNFRHRGDGQWRPSLQSIPE
ncbi:hypothetical protein ACP70R_004400 [Stipagrostis hirtigluma subsp. patula]